MSQSFGRRSSRVSATGSSRLLGLLLTQPLLLLLLLLAVVVLLVVVVVVVVVVLLSLSLLSLAFLSFFVVRVALVCRRGRTP